MSKSGVMEEVKHIHSHPHAIAQCRATRCHRHLRLPCSPQPRRHDLDRLARAPQQREEEWQKKRD